MLMPGKEKNYILGKGPPIKGGSCLGLIFLDKILNLVQGPLLQLASANRTLREKEETMGY